MRAIARWAYLCTSYIERRYYYRYRLQSRVIDPGGSGPKIIISAISSKLLHSHKAVSIACEMKTGSAPKDSDDDYRCSDAFAVAPRRAGGNRVGERDKVRVTRRRPFIFTERKRTVARTVVREYGHARMMIYSRVKRNPVAGGIARSRKGVEPRRGLQPCSHPRTISWIFRYTSERVHAVHAIRVSESAYSYICRYIYVHIYAIPRGYCVNAITGKNSQGHHRRRRGERGP